MKSISDRLNALEDAVLSGSMLAPKSPVASAAPVPAPAPPPGAPSDVAPRPRPLKTEATQERSGSKHSMRSLGYDDGIVIDDDTALDMSCDSLGPEGFLESPSAMGQTAQSTLNLSLTDSTINGDQLLALAAATTAMAVERASISLERDAPLDAEREAMLRRIFDQCDTSGDKKINKRELIKACREHKSIAEFFELPQVIRQEDGSRDEMEKFFQSLDKDDDREISWDEFRAFYVRAVPAASSPPTGAQRALELPAPQAALGNVELDRATAVYRGALFGVSDG